MALKITVITIYALLTITLMLLKGFKIGSRRRGVVKMITASLFVATGIYGCVTRAGQYDYILVIGLGFAALGDLFLVFMNKHSLFVAGVLSFSCASFTITCYAVLSYGFQWWALLPFAILCILNAVCQVKKVYDFGNNVAYLNIYTVLVSLCGSLGLLVLCQAQTTSVILFGLGCLMYMLSDICLGLYLYKFRHRGVDIVNTLLYFPGLLLIAISLVF